MTQKAKDKPQTPKPQATPGAQKPQSRSLYEISQDYHEFEQLIESFEGDVSAEDAQKLADFLEGLDSERDKKINAYCGFIRNIENRRDGRKAEKDRFAKLQKFDDNKIERLKKNLLNYMAIHNLKNLETDKFKLVRATNGSQKLEIGEPFLENPESLPARFRVQTWKPNVEAIRQALEDGEELDFASYAPKGESIRIG